MLLLSTIYSNGFKNVTGQLKKKESKHSTRKVRCLRKKFKKIH